MEGGAGRGRATVPGCSPPPGAATPTRPTPSPTPQAVEQGAERIALVGMSCQASVPAVMSTRKAGKVARRLSLTIGLLCSKTFDDAIFSELFEDALRARALARSPRSTSRASSRSGSTTGAITRSRSKRAHALDARGLQGVPGFRGGARRHRDRRDRCVQRLDAHDHPHRAGTSRSSTG